MDALKPGRDPIPFEIARISVRGCARLFYQLLDKDWLLVFMPSDADHETKARNALDVADPKIVNAIVKSRRADRIWHYVGLRPGVMLVLVPNPDPEPRPLELREAQLLSNDTFGRQEHAPKVRRTDDGRVVVLESESRPEPLRTLRDHLTEAGFDEDGHRDPPPPVESETNDPPLLQTVETNQPEVPPPGDPADQVGEDQPSQPEATADPTTEEGGSSAAAGESQVATDDGEATASPDSTATDASTEAAADAGDSNTDSGGAAGERTE